MNRFGPSQRESSKRWDYTSGNRRTGTYAIGYCGGWQYDRPAVKSLGADFADEWAEEGRKREPLKANYHLDGHATEAEANECYKRFLLDTHLHFIEDRPESNTLHRCQAPCQAFTSGLAQAGGIRQWFLCKEHRTREVVASLLTVGESWTS